jgi:hypothetical protein
MSLRHSIWVVAVLIALNLAANQARGQTTDQQPADSAAQGNAQPPAPAFGQENSPPQVQENPPVSSVDMPNLEPHAAPLSYLQLGVHGSEAVDSNVQNTLGGAGVHSVTLGLGSLEMQRLWSHYDFALDYLGGVGYYNVSGIGLRQIQEFGAVQEVHWKRGEASVRDVFSYQPEGSFGSSYGSIGNTGAALGGLSIFQGGLTLGALGDVPRILNLTLGEVVEGLTPKSSITASGAYAFVHFLGNNPTFGNSFIGSTEASALVGYDRLLGAHDQGALVYGYQEFDFSTGLNFQSQLIQLMWGHRISGRMDFLIGAGPQFTQLNNILTVVPTVLGQPSPPNCVVGVTSQGPETECPENETHITAAGRAMLRYRFPKTSLDAYVEHYLTSGSGFFAGAESTIARLNASRPLGRVWTGFTDLGYARNSRVLTVVCAQGQTNCPGESAPGCQNAITCPGVDANIYDYGYAGLGVRRRFGRSFRVYASYQFNHLTFDQSYCQALGGTGPCDRSANRQIGTVGVDWTPRPVRLD